MSQTADVLIIGAGAAGLSAAKQLAKEGLSYIVVEGSHRIGGRAYSEEIAPGIWFDLGCSYLHQAETNPFVEIADDLGIELGKAHGDMFDYENQRVYHNGVAIGPEKHHAYQAYMKESHRLIEESAERGEDIPVVDLINLDHEFAPLLMHSWSETSTRDIDEMSSMDAAVFEDGGDYPVRNGYGNLVAAWGADIPVSLNTPVTKVDWDQHQVIVETSKGNLSGRAALVTVSTGILGAGNIDFAPGLPDWKMEAIQGVPTGTENKICLYFDRDVFGPEGRGFYNVFNDNGDSGDFEASVMGQNTSISFVGGRFAIWLEKQGQQAAHDYAVDRVAEVFGNDIRKHVTRSIATAWNTEPWTLGSYSCALPGQAHQRRALARPLDDKLFFAGEATTVGDQSCCHGAFRSGIRAAKEITQVL
ncbi:MAG: FAD-dependent oxidoreductase [Pseudomonadota bacterium]